MSRWLLGTGALLVALWFAQPAHASCEAGGQVGGDGSFVDIGGSCDGAGSGDGSGASGGSGGSGAGSGGGSGGGGSDGSADGGSDGSDGSGGGGAPAPQPAFQPIWGSQQETGEPCIDLVARYDVPADSPQAVSWEIEMTRMYHDERLRDVYPRFCVGLAGIDTSPTLWARMFVRSIPIPPPVPSVTPGIAVAGLPAYLEVGDQDGFVVEQDIPGWGRLHVSLRPETFVVTWGDGHVLEVADARRGVPWTRRGEGAPIAHVYTAWDPHNRLGVEAHWVADWSVGPFAGTVRGLRSEAALALPVQEYLAVRLSR